MNISKENIYNSLNGDEEFTAAHYSEVEDIIGNMNGLDDTIIRFDDLNENVTDELWYISEEIYNTDTEHHTEDEIIISGDLQKFAQELNYNVFMANTPSTHQALYQFLKCVENDELGGYKVIIEDCDIDTKWGVGLLQRIRSLFITR